MGEGLGLWFIVQHWLLYHFWKYLTTQVGSKIRRGRVLHMCIC